MHSVIIVGGGPAGISTALHLHAVRPDLAAEAIVLEKSRYPRDKYCAGGVAARAMKTLGAIGVRLTVPAVPIHRVVVKFGDGIVDVREPDLGWVVRRLELDESLAREAMARGIHVREGATVEDVELFDSHAVVRLSGGEVLRARIVVGADGVGGVVRRATGFSRGALRAQVLEMDSRPVADDVPRDAYGFDFSDRALPGYYWDFPTLVDGAPMVCRGVYCIVRGAERSVRDRMADRLRALGLDIAEHRLKFFAERGFEPREPISRPRVLLVGEAAGIDICTGEGIAQAVRYGALAGPYLARAFDTGEVCFSDWRAHVGRTLEGIRLRVRYDCFRAFYGPARPQLERLCVAVPGLTRAGSREFAGKPILPALGHLSLAALRGAPYLLRALPALLGSDHSSPNTTPIARALETI